jgi:ABC-type protease/lipase transport system fused ATPase/permease subunit
MAVSSNRAVQRIWHLATSPEARKFFSTESKNNQANVLETFALVGNSHGEWRKAENSRKNPNQQYKQR